MPKVLKQAYTYTCRGLVNINDLTLNDSVFTIKGRWQEIDSFVHEPLTKWAKTEQSLWVPMSDTQEVHTQKILNIPKIFPPRDANSDVKDVNFWYMVGFLCKNYHELPNFQKDTELYTFVRRLNSFYSPLFNLPMNVLTLQRNKLEAFIGGLNLDQSDLRSMNKRTRLLIVTILQRIKVSFSTKHHLLLGDLTTVPSQETGYIRLLKVKDGGYYVNGLYVEIKHIDGEVIWSEMKS